MNANEVTLSPATAISNSGRVVFGFTYPFSAINKRKPWIIHFIKSSDRITVF
jgi:hypothetical protein